jgi:flagellar hook assembly protein FlgD
VFDSGNFPNPFKTVTRFAYELTHTVDDFNLTIYSVDGRKIKQFKLGSTLGDFSPNIGGFHEIIWDGRDEWGDNIASGVYFYKYRVKYNSKTFTNIGKVAIAR